MQRWDFGQFWRRKLSGLHNTSVHGVWQALGDQAFELQDFVFAADFYAQSLVDEDEDEGCSSCRTIYRYLFSLTQFTGPCDTTHRQQCQLAAWRVAKKFRWNRTLYGDMDYWRLRDLYAQSFPSIYRAVFEWDAMYAERIARWWKVLCARVSDVDDADSTNAQEAVDNQASPREESKIQKKTTRRRKKRTSEVSAISTVKMPSTTRIMQQPSPKRASPSRRDIKRDKVSVRSNHMGVTGSGTIGSYVGLEDVDTSRSHGASCALLGASKSTPDFYEASPTKRKFGAVRYASCFALVGMHMTFSHHFMSSRRLRKQRLSDDLSPASPRLDAGGESVPSDAASQPESLLELYPLRTSSSDQSFLLSVGRKPGLAELNMQKLEEFARLAHYRARVIAAQHVEVSALAPERVKPRWLLDFDKAVSLLTSFKRSKQRLDDDSIAHISEVHARLVFQLAAIRRYYVSEFGATAFVLRLQSLILQLSNWRFQRVAELTEVLEATKQMAMEEEKRRNLEFYHVHRG
jgi:hypothetical protein